MLTKKSLLSLLVILCSLTFVSCSSDSKKSETSDVSVQSSDGQNSGLNFELNSDSDSGKAGPLKTVFFSYDSSTLSSDAKAALENNANFLKNNSSVEVQIEGHCDERGGVQYNIALGDKRAKAVKNYLVALGVSASKITVISYGKERPVAFGHDDGAWGQNRRANFVVTAK